MSIYSHKIIIQLEVAEPGEGWDGGDVNGVENANIAEVNGVPIANIAEVNAVPDAP